jgi:glucose-1-phosphate cytidylyltransferase
VKVVILAGGLGTRISEETIVKPKPMVEIGGKPILWHIMKGYSAFNFNDFIICLGYKGYVIKEYFANYFLHMSDITFDLGNKNVMQVHENYAEPWKVTLVDTGENTMTGGRVKRILRYVGEETFMLTYGDGLADINIKKLLSFHQRHGKHATLTATQPLGRFGSIDLDGRTNRVLSFREKPSGGGGWINGGFFIFEPAVFSYIANDQTVLEREPLENLAKDGELVAYPHRGFWQPMDTLREKNQLESLWQSWKAPWKVW